MSGSSPPRWRWPGPREFLEFLKLVPSARKLADELRALWDRLTSPETPSWQRALIVIAVLEATATIPVEAPVLVGLRLAFLTAFFQAKDRQQHQESESDPESETEA